MRKIRAEKLSKSELSRVYEILTERGFRITTIKRFDSLTRKRNRRFKPNGICAAAVYFVSPFLPRARQIPYSEDSETE